MPNPELREMVDLATAGRVVDWVAIAAAWVAVLSLIWARVRPAPPAGGLRVAGAVAPWSLALAAGWRAYLWRVRFDPVTGFCGLHSVGVLLGNAAAAVALGLLYGLYLRWLWRLPLGGAGQPRTEED